MARMHRNFEGFLEVEELPAAIFVIDVRNEEIAVHEAHRLNIPCIGLVDTNSDPSLVSHPIPGNDDASKSIRIVTEVIMEAIQNGKARQNTQVQSGITPMIRAEFGEDQEDLEVTLPEGYEEIVARDDTPPAPAEEPPAEEPASEDPAPAEEPAESEPVAEEDSSEQEEAPAEETEAPAEEATESEPEEAPTEEPEKTEGED